MKPGGYWVVSSWMTQERAEAEAARRAADLARASSWRTWNRDPKKLQELQAVHRVATQDRKPGVDISNRQPGAISVDAFGGGAGGEKAGRTVDASKQLARVQTSKTLLELGITAEREDAINRCVLRRFIPGGSIVCCVVGLRGCHRLVRHTNIYISFIAIQIPVSADG